MNNLINNIDHSKFDLEWAKRGGVFTKLFEFGESYGCYKLIQFSSGHSGNFVRAENLFDWRSESIDIDKTILRMVTPEELDAHFQKTGSRIEYIDPPMMWRPIEAAPKDGRTIIVGYGRQSGFPQKIVRYNTVHRLWMHYGEADLGLEENATHWMTLPPPPKDE